MDSEESAADATPEPPDLSVLDSLESELAEIERAVERIEAGEEVLEFHYDRLQIGARKWELIKLATIRNETTIVEAVGMAKDAGRKYINVASQVLAGQ